jgi:hypothetical protein
VTHVGLKNRTAARDGVQVLPHFPEELAKNLLDDPWREGIACVARERAVAVGGSQSDQRAFGLRRVKRRYRMQVKDRDVFDLCRLQTIQRLGLTL